MEWEQNRIFLSTRNKMDDVRKMLEQKHKVGNHLILRQNLNKYLNHREVVEPLCICGRFKVEEYVEEQ